MVSPHAAYFEEGFNPGFREKYKGVIVNACHDSGYGHFAIRKPTRRVKGKLCTKVWVMWKNRRERWYGLSFSDAGHSIEIDADMKNPSSKKLKFDKDTYEDLKEHIPEFLEMIGFKFETCTSESGITLKIKELFEISDGICSFSIPRRERDTRHFLPILHSSPEEVNFTLHRSNKKNRENTINLSGEYKSRPLPLLQKGPAIFQVITL